MGPGSYLNKFLRVNLSTGSITTVSFKEDELMSWLGGRGLGVYIMLKEVDPTVEPFSPENKLLILTGPLTGMAGAPEPGRWCSVTKSPLTYTVHDAHSGGDFGPELRFAGYDGIIVEGRSEKPVYLFIVDGKAELRDASHLWGRDVHTVTDELVEELQADLGDDARHVKVATIGPAGENLVRIANIMNDKNRAAGRGGHGAVMGYKRLKAIAVRGHERPKPHDIDEFRSAVKKSLIKHKESLVTSQGLPTYGTAILVNIINNAGIFPTRNFQTGVFPGAENISGEAIAETILDKKLSIEESCWGCAITCARYTILKEGRYTGEGGGPEYETVWSLGAETGTSDLSAVTKANFLCNELGLDTISMGVTIGTLFELVEKGKYPMEKLRGLKAQWGSGEAVVDLVWRTAYRSGVGDDLAEGAKRLAEKYGAPEIAMHVRGQELPAYDPRGAQGHGLAYATSNRGGCHLRAYIIAPEVLGVPSMVDRFETKGKAELVIHFQNVFSVIDSLVLCKFTSFAIWLDEYTHLINSAVGWNLSNEDVEKIGERIYNAERVFNSLSIGDGIKYDTLPKRLLEEPMPEGPTKGHVVKLKEMLPEFYKLRGWVDGRPSADKLEDLGLGWLVDKMDKAGVLPR
jgi:aldehyde:ferredoxin oxidoreductase